MPEKKTIEKARRAKRHGRSASSQAGEFVREQIHKIRRGKHGARSAKQAIAIGLSEARRAGVDLPPPDKASPETRRAARRDVEVGQGKRKPKAPSARRSKAVKRALKREGRSAASHQALSKHARAAASKRSAADRSRAAKKAARTKGPAERSAAAKKAARTRAAKAR